MEWLRDLNGRLGSSFTCVHFPVFEDGVLSIRRSALLNADLRGERALRETVCLVGCFAIVNHVKLKRSRIKTAHFC